MNQFTSLPYEEDENDDSPDQIDMDELYDVKQNRDLKTLTLFTKILKRIHVRIKAISRQKNDVGLCFYTVQEVIIGAPKYDYAACIAFLLDKLTKNGFSTRFVHPNVLIISWAHYVPKYVRNEIKQKTGILLNNCGQRVDANGNSVQDPSKTPNVGHQGPHNSANFYTPQHQTSNQNQIPVCATATSRQMPHYNADVIANSKSESYSDDNDFFNTIQERSHAPTLTGPNKKDKKDYTPVTSYKPSGKILYSDDIMGQMADTLR
jgi:hypothetical protein